MTLTIYHNPRCRKSREALQYLEENGFTHKIIRYLDNPLSQNEMELLYKQLGEQIHQLIRTNEALWKTDFKGKIFSKEQQIQLLIKHPKLMERPIISDGKKAVIARPIEKLYQFLK